MPAEQSMEETPLVEQAGRQAEQQYDLLTVAALGLLAMCVVTLDHEALGHGGACLLLSGHIRVLTSSVFRCDVASAWVDGGGPMLNVIAGALALVVRQLLPTRFIKMRLWLVLVTALSFFWEGGYLIHAMHREDGDLYLFARAYWGGVSATGRWLGAALGLALYLATVRLTSRALLQMIPNAKRARTVAQTAWGAAALGATIAGALGPGLKDAVLEVALASFPLLLIPREDGEARGASSVADIPRDSVLIASALIVFAVFAATMGRGMRW